jgi:sulfite reductase (NADPH) hemoprotein beta-component
MYVYSDFDEAFVRDRVATFRGQVARRIDGRVDRGRVQAAQAHERPLPPASRLHAAGGDPLRHAVPAQMRQLAYIAERWDKGYGHFTTRQNIQFNWPRSFRTCPTCSRRWPRWGCTRSRRRATACGTSPPTISPGAAADEIEDPRPFAELLRQWSTDHPEFQFLPRKFKIAVTGSPNDRAVTRAHDIGLRVLRRRRGRDRLRGERRRGLGRTPMLGRVIRDWLPQADLLPYVEAILASTTSSAGGTTSTRHGSRSWSTRWGSRRSATSSRRGSGRKTATVEFSGVDQDVLARIAADFAPPTYSVRKPIPEATGSAAFARLERHERDPHRVADHAIVTISLKAHGRRRGTPRRTRCGSWRTWRSAIRLRGTQDQPPAERHPAPCPPRGPAGGSCWRCGRRGSPPPTSG